MLSIEIYKEPYPQELYVVTQLHGMITESLQLIFICGGKMSGYVPYYRFFVL